MKILFGPYGCILSSLGISSNARTIKRQGSHLYRIAVELIARGYLNAGATLPTVNAFFLRTALREGFDALYKDLLYQNLEALFTAIGDKIFDRIAICLGPANDCYQPERAPSVEESYQFALQQYELCLEVCQRFGLFKSEIVILHETIGTDREALGIARAAQSCHLPIIISFVTNREGLLLNGERIEPVIAGIDTDTAAHVEGFALNCCSPHAFDRVVTTFKEKKNIKRLIGFYPNSWDANPISYETEEELLEPRKTLSLKKIIEIGRNYDLKFIGGCCGFGYHDIEYLAQSLRVY